MKLLQSTLFFALFLSGSFATTFINFKGSYNGAGCSTPTTGVGYTIQSDLCMNAMEGFIQNEADWSSSIDTTRQSFLLYSYDKSSSCSGKSLTTQRYYDGQCAETPKFLQLNSTYSQISITDAPDYGTNTIIISQYSQNNSQCDQSNLLFSIIYDSGFEMNDASTEEKVTFFCREGRPFQKSCKYVNSCITEPINQHCEDYNQNRVVYCN